VRHAFAVALAAMTVMGCAPAQDSTPAAAAAPAKAACTPPPRELVVKDLEQGTGQVVVARNPVYVSYTGWFYDGCAKDMKGAQFDSSEGRVTPFGFIVGAGRVIKGWDEGVVGMKEKGKRLLVTPPDKAYGAAGAGGGKIPPNATLVFEVTLLNIIPMGAPAKAQ
jgi:FKBP-type peptidyl-prolyl cis-trans isomerase FkpA